MVVLAGLVKVGTKKNKLRQARAVSGFVRASRHLWPGQPCVFELVHLGNRPVPIIVEARKVGCWQKSGRVHVVQVGFHN